MAIYIYEMDDPSQAGRAFTDSPSDRWWVEYYKDVHGIDLEELSVEEPRGRAEARAGPQP